MSPYDEPVFSINLLPYVVCDVIDLDWLCPIVVCTSTAIESIWDEASPIYKDDEIEFYMDLPKVTDIGFTRTSRYWKKYNTSYYVIVQLPFGKDELNHLDLSRAIDLINKYKARTIQSLSAVDYNRRFVYFESEEKAKEFKRNEQSRR